MEKELYASNAKIGWFEYKLGEIEHQLSKVNFRTSSLKEKIHNLDVKAEL